MSLLGDYPPRTRSGVDGLRAVVERPAAALIALDFDGTLAPIVADPSGARADPAAVRTLAGLSPFVGATVIVTGRPAREAADYGALWDVPGLVVFGQYGLERWEGGRLAEPPRPHGVAEVREKLPKVLGALGVPEGVTVEDKGHAFAVHTRRAAEPETALERLRGPLEALAERAGMRLEPGRMVVELRPPGTDKGDALREFAVERRCGAVLYAGDDLGDLAAFDAVDELRASGVPGVTVCSGSDEVAVLAERADLVVDGPPGVGALLRAILDAVSSEEHG